MSSWITRYGVPLYVISDQGRQFESEIFSHLSQLVGFHRLRSAAYHPQTNGMVERIHRVLKTSLKARNGDWLLNLPIVLMGIRCVPNSSGSSPFEMLTGSQMLVPRTTVSPDVNINSTVDFVEKLTKNFKEVDFATLSQGVIHGNQTEYISPSLKNATHVWLRVDRTKRPLEAPYCGPYPLKNISNNTVTIKKDGHENKISLSRIKPAFLSRPLPTTPKEKENTTELDSKTTTKSGRKVQFPKNLKEYHTY